MRTVHETEALRPSDPVPKHHSSNPSNKFQRLRLVLNNERQKNEKGSTPASPSHAPNSATLPPPGTTPVPSAIMGSAVPLSADAEYAHNNVVYTQDLALPDAPVMVQFPPDVNFTHHELSLPAPELFSLLRRQLHWATQQGEQLRAEAEVMEKQRKDEWIAKELVMENLMEAELATIRRKRLEAGQFDEPESFKLLEADIQPSKKLNIQPKQGKIPWWREEAWAIRQREAQTLNEGVREGITEREMPRPEPQDNDLKSGLKQEEVRQEQRPDIQMPDPVH